jgi:hypothetical protein
MRKELIDGINEAENFFKHADRDPTSPLASNSGDGPDRASYRFSTFSRR